MPLQKGTIGGIGLKNDEFKQIVLEVTEDAVQARQAAYDTVMEILSEVVTGDEALALLRSINMEAFAQIAARDPDQAREMLRAVREAQ